MNRFFIRIFLILLISFNLFSIVPIFYGARSLSLGFSSSAFNYDVNSIFINPAILSELQIPVGAYQFESGNFAYKNFYDDLSSLTLDNIKNYSQLSEDLKGEISDNLRNIFGSKFGMYGFQANIPGFVVKRYGFSVSFFSLTIINPISNSLTDKKVSVLSQDEINNLKFNVIGLKYRQYSVAYGVDLSKSMSLGVTVHYLNGKVGISDRSVTDDFFYNGYSEKEYSQNGWAEPKQNFGKFIADVSINSRVGKFFNFAVIVKNISNPTIETDFRELEIKERFIVSLAFRPENKFGLYFDLDLKKKDLLFSGNEIQPVSIGVEKIFFNGKFTVRGGILSDLTEHYIFGKRSNILYGLGLGVNTGNFLVDAGIGLGNDGKLRSIAISGFYIIK